VLVLVHAAPATLEQHRRPNLGILSSPGRWYRDVGGWTWAADNGAFGGFDPGKFREMLDGIMDLPPPVFVACPDYVGNASATAALFWQWRDELAERKLPVALVAQDGLTTRSLGSWWDEFDALFIGGFDGFKLGPDAAELAREAMYRGKWVHWGRVSSLKRFRYIKSVGGDSCDGNINNRFRTTYLDRNVGAAAAPPQGRLVP
jgi:hypothetical protein